MSLPYFSLRAFRIVLIDTDGKVSLLLMDFCKELSAHTPLDLVAHKQRGI